MPECLNHPEQLRLRPFARHTSDETDDSRHGFLAQLLLLAEIVASTEIAEAILLLFPDQNFEYAIRSKPTRAGGAIQSLKLLWSCPVFHRISGRTLETRRDRALAILGRAKDAFGAGGRIRTSVCRLQFGRSTLERHRLASNVAGTTVFEGSAKDILAARE